MITLLNNNLLSAKLPRLGPLIGWTRRADGKLRARLWIQVDDTEDEPPVFALSAVWDRAGKHVRKDTARAWKLTRGYPPDMNPPAWLHFAVADVEIPVGNDCVIRMVSVHRMYGADRPPEFKPFAYDLGDASTASLPAMVKGTTQFLAAGELPEPTPVAIDKIFPEIAGNYDQLAEACFAQIQARLEKSAAIVRAPIRDTRSRRALMVRSFDECEAELAPSARAQLAAEAGSLRFAAACCQHPGVGWDAERAARSLAALQAESQKETGPAFALLTGDQIYADATGGVFDIADRFEKLAMRYEEAYGAAGFRNCASRLPVYMAADDHEIEDGWSHSRLAEPQVSMHERRRRRQFATWAQMLFIAYQRLHAPISPPPTGGWYDFKAAGIPFFVMDTRFERIAWGGTGAPEICGDTQFKALLAWLDEVKKLDVKGAPLEGVPKFIVSGSVFAPGLEEFVRDPGAARRADNWQAFAGQRARLVTEIAERGLRNVVFLSGDYHCGAVAAIELAAPAGPGAEPLAAYAIVSPPAYAPFPFANVRAAEVAGEEALVDLKDASHRVEAEATEGEGYAEIRVAQGAGDWSVEVRYVGPGFKEPDTGQPFARRLAGGRIHRL